MADPLFNAPILDELQRHHMHTEGIKKALADLRRLLDREGIPFALIGALAMQHRGFVRHTEDIDILTTREGLDLIHQRVVGLGIVPRAQGRRKKLRHTVYKVDIDVIQAGGNAGANDSPYLFPDPRSDAFVDEGGDPGPEARDAGPAQAVQRNLGAPPGGPGRRRAVDPGQPTGRGIRGRADPRGAREIPRAPRRIAARG